MLIIYNDRICNTCYKFHLVMIKLVQNQHTSTGEELKSILTSIKEHKLQKPTTIVLIYYSGS